MAKKVFQKLHPPLLRGIVQALSLIFHENRKASKAIEFTLRSNKKWGSRDRSFIAEHTYDMVRWWRLLHFINGSPLTQHHDSLLWSLLGIHLKLKEFNLPDWTEFKRVNALDIEKALAEAKKERAVMQSIPDWLDKIGEDTFSEAWEDELTALNTQAPVYLRYNSLKTDKASLIKELSADGIEAVEVSKFPYAVRVLKRKNLFSTSAFKKGLFEVQDAGSQSIAPFLEVEPGMRVIDACAGAGGKTLHLAALTANKGSVIAMDTEAWKLQELKKRAKRQGVHNVETREIIGSKTIKRLRESADRVLLDVPCTGLGVLRRNPDAKWKINPEYLHELLDLQYDILSRYAQMLKPGGKLVYATCSILSQENENQVQRFLKAAENYSLEKEITLSPFKNNTDGFYMALLNKA